jgi:uncharacterized protein (TIGR04255 family)
MATYPKNFLSNVIARVDYQPILILKEKEPAEFQELIREEYPRFSKIQELQISIPPDESSVSAQKPVIWRFSDKEQKDEISLSFKFFAFKTVGYINFKDFFQKLSKTYNHFTETYKPTIVSRIGLRYINEIRISDGNPFEWKYLINEKLFSVLHAFPDLQVNVSRSMHQLHFNKEDFKIVFQFGIFNSEYPNTITKKEFILDYDCISEEEHEPNSILDKFKRFNEEVYDLFEKSIDEKLRNLMKEGEVK